MSHGSTVALRQRTSYRVGVSTTPVKQSATKRCWWCGREMSDGAVLQTFQHRRSQLCCLQCARSIDVPGLYLG
jgi:hypothetical protein